MKRCEACDPTPFVLWSFVGSLLFVPLMGVFFGKRWYCSWVCGCGGLANTAGDAWRPAAGFAAPASPAVIATRSDAANRPMRIRRMVILFLLLERASTRQKLVRTPKRTRRGLL